MELFKIKHRFSQEILFQKKCESFKECVEAACACDINLSCSDLSCCALYYSNFISAKSKLAISLLSPCRNLAAGAPSTAR